MHNRKQSCFAAFVCKLHLKIALIFSLRGGNTFHTRTMIFKQIRLHCDKCSIIYHAAHKERLWLT